MNIEEYERMYHFEDWYWWFQGRKYILDSLLKKHQVVFEDKPAILDAGCGTGLYLADFVEKGRAVGLDFSELALRYCRQRGIQNLVRANVTVLPFQDNSFDLVIALDLIEHIEDDEKILSELYRVCRPGGVLCFTVPAHQYLWSEHDEALHHYRRYSYQSFERLLKKLPIQIDKYSYAISFTFFPIVAFRMLQKVLRRNQKPKTHLIALPRWINRILIWFLRIEAKLLETLNLPFGVSLVAICRKPDMPTESGEACLERESATVA